MISPYYILVIGSEGFSVLTLSDLSGRKIMYSVSCSGSSPTINLFVKDRFHGEKRVSVPMTFIKFFLSRANWYENIENPFKLMLNVGELPYEE